MKVLIVGPYGRVNLGDDAIGASIGSYFLAQGNDVSITTIDGNPFESLPNATTLRLPILRKLIFGALTSVRQFDYVIIGGGQQIQEPRISNPFWGHLANAFLFAVATRFYKRKLLVLGVGVDKEVSSLGRAMIRYLTCPGYSGHRVKHVVPVFHTQLG